MENRTLRVYDTTTGEVVEIEVSQEIYDAYMRTFWNIHDNNESFFAHEIQFSQLIGGNNNRFENFHEFMADKEITEREAVYRMMYKRLHECIEMLSKNDQELVKMLYFEMRTEKECAEILHTTQQNIHKKKRRILCKLYKLL